MEPKKNPKANVGRNSSLYFAIGLALMLFLTNYAINFKTYDDVITDIGVVSMDEVVEEEIPITNLMQTPPPPPPPPASPDVIEIVEDEVEIE
jgi:protein TonB